MSAWWTPRMMTLLPRSVLAILSALLLTPISRAGISPQVAWAILSPKGDQMLVMVPFPSALARSSSFCLPDGRVLDLRTTFAQTGVYRVPSLQPVWQVNSYSLRGDVVLSDDLRHMCIINRRGLKSLWAIAFYTDGQMTRSYNCATLLTGLRHWKLLPYSTWDWHVQWYDNFDLDNEANQVRLSTARREFFIADKTFNLGRQEFYTFN